METIATFKVAGIGVDTLVEFCEAKLDIITIVALPYRLNTDRYNVLLKSYFHS